MKKTIILAFWISLLALTGCKGEPKHYGTMPDLSQYDTEDSHVVYAESKDGCYTDGSFDANVMYEDWLEEYEASH